MPVYLQGFYQEFGFNNIYDPWSEVERKLKTAFC
jgi:predicted GNAT family N-acyltransferase